MARRSYFNIEALMNNHGAAGKSIVRNIMSYLPIQTLTRGLKVSKTWYRFLNEEKGLWMTFLDKPIQKAQRKLKFQSNEILEQWLELADLIESNGNAADVINFISRFHDSFGRKYGSLTKFEFKQVPLEAAINDCERDYEWHDVRFLKTLIKLDFLDDLQNSNNMADEIFTQRLLNWAVKEKGLEALKLVIPIVEDKYRITSYGFKRTPGTGGKSHHDPIYEAIMMENMGVAKLKMLIPLVARKTFWNSGNPHTPLADAIKVGNLEMVKEIIPFTKINTISKKFGSYFHVAVQYGRLEIFKHLAGLVENWETLENQNGETAEQFFMEEDFKFTVYEDPKKRSSPPGEGYSSDELSQEEISAAMAEIQPAKKMRYSDRWGGSGYSKKKDLKEMQKKKYFEDLYYEFLNYFQEEESGDD